MVRGFSREGEQMDGKRKVKKGIDQVKTTESYTNHGYRHELCCSW